MNTLRSSRNLSPILGISLGLMALTACSTESKLDASRPVEVVGHRYVEASTTDVDVCVAYDQSGMCTISVPVPYDNPEEWRLSVRQCVPDADKCQNEELAVAHEQYDRIADGAVVQLDEKHNIVG